MVRLIYKRAWRRHINSTITDYEAIIFIVTNAGYVIIIRN